MPIERNRSRKASTCDAVSARRLNTQQRYDHPRDVLATALDKSEKRAILASWASDLFAVDSRPDLRLPPGVSEPIHCPDILDALMAVDDHMWGQDGAADVSREHSWRP